ncbi:MAG: hypothetical protein P8Z71_07795 [Candidatus Sulfobium sp.]
MISPEFIRQTIYYFVKLPLFSLQLRRNQFSALEDISSICPSGPKTEYYHNAIVQACGTHSFLGGRDPERLFGLYNAISAIREADTFIYPFLTNKNLRSFNEFRNIEILSLSYEKGPVLILYAHTGSYYQASAASGVLGYKVYPIAYGTDLTTMEKPFRWLFQLNMSLSERHFSGGSYLYTNTPSFTRSLKKIVAERERAIIYSAIDLPLSFMDRERREVPFLEGKTALPHKLVKMFLRRLLPVVIAFSSVRIIEGKVKRVLHFEKIPDSLQVEEILRYYASRLEDFLRRDPEQFLNLINIGDFYV